MSWFITNLIAVILLPPLSLLLISLSGLLLWHRRPGTAHALLGSAFVLLWLLSTPFLAESMLHTLEDPALASINKGQTADAIIVLGGGSYFHAPEYAGDTVSSTSLQRLRYAAKLYRDIKKPVLLSGGTPHGSGPSEALLMKQVLEQEFNTPVHWIEEESDNTFAAAHGSYQLLQKYGIKRIYLVTHAWHMPRSRQAFQAAGFEVVPAPTVFTTRYQFNLMTLIPSANALHDSQIYLHEIIGILWYRLRLQIL